MRNLMTTITLLTLIAASLLLAVSGQSCQQGSAIVRLLNVDTCRSVDPIIECTSKMQITTSPMCAMQFQSDLKVSQDGTYCEESKGMMQRGAVSGQWSMGKSDLMYDLRTINNPAYAGMLLMHIKGRIVPDQGGRETQVDCNLLLNVTAGSVLGIVSLGQDRLMTTTYIGPALPATAAEAGPSQSGSYSSGMGQVQQQGNIGMQNGMVMQQQATMQSGQTIPSNPYTAAVSSAIQAPAQVGLMAGLLGGLLFALRL